MSIFDRLKKLAFPPEAAAPAQPVPQEKVFTFGALAQAKKCEIYLSERISRLEPRRRI